MNTTKKENVRPRSKSFKKEAPSALSLCRYSRLRKNCIICGTIFGIANYVYYGSVFGLEALKGSIYFNSLFSAGADIIGYLLISYTLAKFKRRTVFWTTLGLIMIFSFSFYFVIVPKKCADDDQDFCW